MKNLENYGVQEMNAREIRRIDGGIIPLLIWGAQMIIYAIAADMLLNSREYAEAIERKIN